MNRPFNWKVFFILWAAAIFGVVAVIPYSLELQGNALENLDLPISLPVLVAIQVAQNALLFGLLIIVGLLFASRIGLGAPILEARVQGETAMDQIRAILPVSIIVGVIAALLIIGLDLAIFQPALLRELGESANFLSLDNAQPAAWKGFLASFYGGIVEEILLRLFLMSFLAWVGKFVSHTHDGFPTSAVLWIANILAALIFGLAHLPATATLIPLTPLVITRAILLNGLGGVAFGWLYWKRGLEAAMVAHFSADIVLHVLLAL
ncbi:MAG TPA: CPBP family intramembrane glutamic endopeptidase [Anaerolineales bacterium]|nr:CPBP family intramembrane glutamic endopeptidase [Anaerolineales bacterium]